MKLLLFKIPMPMTVDEYKVAQLWAVAEASKKETGGGSGIEVLENTLYTETMEDGSTVDGCYTHKIYHIKDKVPGWVRVFADKVIGKEALDFHEKAWNAFPYCKTVITHPRFENFELVVESFYQNDRGDCQRPSRLKDSEYLKLDGNPVKIEDVHTELLNIADLPDICDEDPTKYMCEKASRGPIPPMGKWWETFPEPVMCCYKLVRFNFKYFGLQTRVENYFVPEERKLFLRFNKQVFCWMDKWYGLNMEDIRRIEKETQEELSRQLNAGEARGYKPEGQK